MTTKLLYMSYMNQLTCEAVIESVSEENGKTVVVLNQTVFYPQGGGQPYDTGVIVSPTANFTVTEVRFVDGVVKHFGTFTDKSFKSGDSVRCEVGAERRQLNSRLHSAGHVLDMAVHALGYDWTPGKGYHFPDGPYVEYSGDFDADAAAELGRAIEQKANEFITAGILTHIEFMPKEVMSAVCRYVPEFLPEGKPARVVFYGDYGVPCGGTHVANLAEIKHMTIAKIKREKGNIRVSYTLAEEV